MTVLREGNLTMRLPNGVTGRKFDGAAHSLPCMSAVDFIIERDDHFMFVELKGQQGQQLRKRVQRMKHKYLDSFLYEWASGRANKPIHYYVFLDITDLEPARLIAETDELQREMPTGVPTEWPDEAVVGFCAIFSIDTWNARFPDYPVTRTNSSGGG